MSENVLTKINNIPVRTWRWLGVNNITIDSVIPETTPYPNNLISSTEDAFILTPMTKDKNSYALLKSLNYEGISDGLMKQVVDEYNTGFYFQMESGQKSKNPIGIHYSVNQQYPNIIDNNVIIAKENSEVTLMLEYKIDEHAQSSTQAYHNGLTRIYCEKGATVNLIKIQTLSDESNHFDACIATLEEDAHINYILVELGSQNSITNVRTDLKGRRSSANLHTVYLGDKDRKIDINYLMNHVGVETKSNIEAKGALLDHSGKTFRGTLDFKKGARKAVGQEEEYAVLLSKEVRNRSVPMLLCSEDDVSGQHAASAGKIDENKLFYLMTRGFSKAEAKKLIIEAAISPIIDLIPVEEKRDAIYEIIRGRLTNE